MSKKKSYEKFLKQHKSVAENGLNTVKSIKFHTEKMLHVKPIGEEEKQRKNKKVA